MTHKQVFFFSVVIFIKGLRVRKLVDDGWQTVVHNVKNLFTEGSRETRGNQPLGQDQWRFRIGPCSVQRRLQTIYSSSSIVYPKGTGGSNYRLIPHTRILKEPFIKPPPPQLHYNPWSRKVRVLKKSGHLTSRLSSVLVRFGLIRCGLTVCDMERHRVVNSK